MTPKELLHLATKLWLNSKSFSRIQTLLFELHISASYNHFIIVLLKGNYIKWENVFGYIGA